MALPPRSAHFLLLPPPAAPCGVPPLRGRPPAGWPAPFPAPASHPAPGRYLEGSGRGRMTPRWAPTPRARLGAEAGIPLDRAPANPTRRSQAPGTLELESCVVPPATPPHPHRTGRFVRCTVVAQMQRAGRRSHAWPGPGRLRILSLGRC